MSKLWFAESHRLHLHPSPASFTFPSWHLYPLWGASDQWPSPSLLLSTVLHKENSSCGYRRKTFLPCSFSFWCKCEAGSNAERRGGWGNAIEGFLFVEARSKPQMFSGLKRNPAWTAASFKACIQKGVPLLMLNVSLCINIKVVGDGGSHCELSSVHGGMWLGLGHFTVD